MFPCNVLQLQEIVNGRLQSVGDGQIAITGVSIDSRLIQPGDAFFALPGQSHHGIQFAAQAIASGAACIVTNVAPPLEFSLPPTSTLSGSGPRVCPVILVPDPLQALQAFSRWNRLKSDALVIGITGSVGKTTTRQMIQQVLRQGFRSIQSPKNFNNELGVPLSLLQLQEGDEIAVLEMGAGKPGDIRFLCELAKPEIAVVTRVAPCHLQTFGDLQAIQQTKQELVSSIPQHGLVILNGDDALVREMSSVAVASAVFYGEHVEASLQFTPEECVNGHCSFRMGGDRFQFAGGRHLIPNAAAAVALGRILGLTSGQISSGLESFQPDPGRGRIVLREPWTVIDETYNASPASVSACIREMNNWTGRRRILVLGDMLELGTEEEQYHREIVQLLAQSNVDHTVFVGKHSAACAEAALEAGLPLNRVSAFSHQLSLDPILECLLSEGDILCVKGSRAVQLDRLVQRLLQHRSAGVKAA
jgi:UDP-N-acetylmuramoyl-tripeptide--D-alanyl-D-alanine ligase